MNKPNKKTIGGVVLASILIGGFIIFTPQSASADLTVLDKFGTILVILTDIQNIVIDIQTTVNNIFNEITDPDHGLEEIKREVRIIETNVTSSEHGLKEIKREVRNIEGNVTLIQDDLKDKLKLIVNSTEPEVELFNNDNVTITISARNMTNDFVNFNLKEVYACAELVSVNEAAGSLRPIEVEVEQGDIVIRDSNGDVLEGQSLVSGSEDLQSCADLITLLTTTDRAGAVGLGSDTDIVIRLRANLVEGASINFTFVKCIAFVPQEAVTLICEPAGEIDD